MNEGCQLKLAGKKAIVTGGASGIGAATCRMLAREGADVAILDINLEGAEAVVREVRQMGRKGLALRADVGVRAEVDTAMSQMKAEFGDVDILVNNAGIINHCPFPDMTFELWERSIAVHIHALYYCTHPVIKGMIAKGFGRIVNISSVVGLVGSPNLAAYSAAKAGIIGFTKGLAKEVATKGITVNIVAPGSIKTSMYAHAYSDTVQSEKLRQERLAFNMSRTPMGRQGTVDEVAATVIFLCSADGAFYTGQVLSPNGGFWM